VIVFWLSLILTHKPTAKVVNACDQPSMGLESSRASEVDLDVLREDVGSSISRQVPMDTLVTVVEHSNVDSNALSILEMSITPPLVCTAIDAVERATVRASEKSTVKVATFFGTASASQNPRLKKAKKKKHDEIDDIFNS